MTKRGRIARVGRVLAALLAGWAISSLAFSIFSETSFSYWINGLGELVGWLLAAAAVGGIAKRDALLAAMILFGSWVLLAALLIPLFIANDGPVRSAVLVLVMNVLAIILAWRVGRRRSKEVTGDAL